MRITSILCLSFFAMSCAVNRVIIDKPIIFDQERKNLTLEYMSHHYGMVQEEPTIEPKIIVLHWSNPYPGEILSGL